MPVRAASRVQWSASLIFALLNLFAAAATVIAVSAIEAKSTLTDLLGWGAGGFGPS
jgi:hypothetical protein